MLYSTIKLVTAFVGGAVAMVLLSSNPSTNFLSASVSEEMLNVRSDGLVRTQKEEITRLRGLLQDAKCDDHKAANTTTLLPSTGNGARCSTHEDCKSSTDVCQNNECVPLSNPACGCQINDGATYILCIANNGEGPQARTISCGNATCSNHPTPRCVQE